MSTLFAAPLLARFIEFVDSGTSLLIATRDAAHGCEVVRVAAACLLEQRIQLLVPLPEGERSLRNLAANGCIALTAAHPTSYRAFQIKGRDASLASWPEMESAAERHFTAMAAELAQLGVSPEQTARLWSRSYVAVAFTPEALFEQTPGPVAGRPLS
jgi:hypothetical protein